MAELTVENIHKRLGSVDVLKGVSLELQKGEVVALLGHSGSGKTTILRSVAGLEVPDRGRILLGDRVVFDAGARIMTPPEKRGLGLVFQSYALWPNRTVFENVAYALKLRKMGDEAIRKQVMEVLGRLGLGVLDQRYPHQLSGGQQQRVALARALAYQPPVLLLDEPLSNLDAKLREEARAWLRGVIVESKISVLYVTHDQVEAMAIADRMLLLHNGEVEQAGRPHEIYDQPATALAAHFMGSNNRFDGAVSALNGGRARLDFGKTSLWGKAIGPCAAGEAATAFVRIERTKLTDSGGDPSRLEFTVQRSIYLGERWEHVLERDGVRIRAWGPDPLDPGAQWLEFHPDNVWIFPGKAPS